MRNSLTKLVDEMVLKMKWRNKNTEEVHIYLHTRINMLRNFPTRLLISTSNASTEFMFLRDYYLLLFLFSTSSIILPVVA